MKRAAQTANGNALTTQQINKNNDQRITTNTAAKAERASTIAVENVVRVAAQKVKNHKTLHAPHFFKQKRNSGLPDSN